MSISHTKRCRQLGRKGIPRRIDLIRLVATKKEKREILLRYGAQVKLLVKEVKASGEGVLNLD
jgi:hypothetical protein